MLGCSGTVGATSAVHRTGDKRHLELFAVAHGCAVIVWQLKFYVAVFIRLTN